VIDLINFIPKLAKCHMFIDPSPFNCVSGVSQLISILKMGRQSKKKVVGLKPNKKGNKEAKKAAKKNPPGGRSMEAVAGCSGLSAERKDEFTPLASKVTSSVNHFKLQRVKKTLS